MLLRALLLATLLTSLLPADDVLQPGTPELDRPTLMALGVKLPLTGDDNCNAIVSVRNIRNNCCNRALTAAARNALLSRDRKRADLRHRHSYFRADTE